METLNQEQLENLITTAKNAGSPLDQTRRFITEGYVPLPWQWKFHALARECDKQGGPTEVGCGGARGPGKSHCVFAQIGLDDCQRFKNLKGLFLRKTGKAARESFEDLVFKVLSGKVGYTYNTSTGIIKFNTGSRVILGGFENENDVDKYIGIEYDFIAIEELNQLSKDKVDRLLGSMRTARKDWRPRCYNSFNPGGDGHQFVKEKFVIPFRENTERKTRFVPSTYKDNPYLNQEYIEYLEELGGSLGRAWREGDWDLFEGQFFTEWRHEKHVVTPFAIPNSWMKLRSIDVSGREGITSCHWYAIDNDGRVWCYREYYKSGLDSDQHADSIAELSEGEEYRYTTIDNSAFSKLGLPETTAEVYERHGVDGLVPAMKNRIMGWDIMHQYLRWDEEKKPKMLVFDTCHNLIRTIPQAVHDEKHPGDLSSKKRKIKIDGVDALEHWDALDDCRYLLQTLREQRTPKPMSFVERRIQQLKQEEKEESFSYQRKYD